MDPVDMDHRGYILAVTGMFPGKIPLVKIDTDEKVLGLHNGVTPVPP